MSEKFLNLDSVGTIRDLVHKDIKSATDKIDSTKQDKIEATAADVGKMVAVDEQGNLSLVPAPSGGTKLYTHKISEFIVNGNAINFITTRSTAYTIANLQDLVTELVNALAGSISIISINVGGSKIRFVYTKSTFTPPSTYEYSLDELVVDLGETITDTVTEL